MDARDVANAISEGLNALVALAAADADASSASVALAALERALITLLDPRSGVVGGVVGGRRVFVEADVERLRRLRALVEAWRATGVAPADMVALATERLAAIEPRLVDGPPLTRGA